MDPEWLHGKWELVLQKSIFKNRDDLIVARDTDNKIITANSQYFYADPFIINIDDVYYIFFEHFDYIKGKIAYIVVDKNFSIIKPVCILNLSIKSHLSYPYIFKDDDTYYMIVESCHTNQVPLFKCKEFPDKWIFIRNILDTVVHCGDNSLIKHNDVYYLFTHSYENKRYYNRIYYSTNLENKFIGHKIVNSQLNKMNEHNTRGAGRIFKINNMLIRPAQFSDRGINGEAVILYKITLLSPAQFNEVPLNIISPILFNYRALHTFSYDVNNDVMVIDGRKERMTDHPFQEINLSEWKKKIMETNFYVDHELLNEVFSYNTSGGGINYYSIEIDGCHYKGERNWNLRWNILKDAYDYQDKKILDIGCNTAITLTYLKKFRNAGYCLGVDMPDSLLVKTNKANTIIAAKKLDDAFQVSNDYLQLDLNNSNYESQIGTNFDIVIVMSILKWIDDKERFLSYLKNFKNIIYEAHEPNDIIVEMFGKIGFHNYKILGNTQIGISYSDNDTRTLFLFEK